MLVKFLTSKKIKTLLAAVLVLFSVVGIFLWTRSSVGSGTNFRIPSVVRNPIKSTDGRVNILLLGNAGGRHDGASLTDSILVASYDLKSNKATLISIPRDLWIDTEQAKVNTIYQTGAKLGEGLGYAKEKFGDILGLPMHYGVRLDFRGFSEAVDLVGGIEVDVPRTFDDYNYPVEGREKDLCGNIEKEIELSEEQATILNLKPGKQKLIVTLSDKFATSSADFACRFERIHFEKGRVIMNGLTALKFVRTRMGSSGEGSDFARSRRQQIVLQAFKEKVLSVETLINPQKIAGLIKTLGSSVETDIPIDKFWDFYNLVKKNEGVTSIVLGDLGGGKSVLVSPPPAQYGGAYILIPSDNDFSKLKDFMKTALSATPDEVETIKTDRDRD